MSQHDPYAIEELDPASEDREQGLDTAKDRVSDLVWLTSGVRGRRFLRWLLAEAGITGADIRSSFHSNYGLMCHIEGKRAFGLLIFGALSQALARGDIPQAVWQKLMSAEADHG